MKSKWTVFLKRAPGLCQMAEANCIWMFLEMRVYTPLFLHIIPRGSVSAYKAGRSCWMKAYAEWVPEWVGGGKNLPPLPFLFCYFVFPLTCDMISSKSFSNPRALRKHLTTKKKKKVHLRTPSSSLGSTSQWWMAPVHFQSPAEAATNSD